MYKSMTPGRGWLRILWDRGKQHSRSVQALIREVEQIPGCRALVYGGIDLPHTAWMLEPVVELVVATTHDAELVADCLSRLAAGDYTQFAALWRPQRPLYTFQLVGAYKVYNSLAGCLLGDDMGLGKTPTAIVAAETLRRARGDNAKVLIVGPIYTREVWLRELLVMGAIESREQFQAFTGRSPEHEPLSNDARYYFVHYDIVNDWCGQFLSNPADKPLVTIIDEAHWAKSPTTRRGKGAAVAALGARHRILLTGTPFENRPAELWHLLTMAGGTGSWGPRAKFRQRYCSAWSNGYGLEDGEPSNVEELKMRMAPMYLRRERKDVELELPELTRTPLLISRESLDLAEHDRELRAADIAALVRLLLEGGVGDRALQLITELRQATSRAKIPTTLAYARNVLDQGESVVVFTWEREVAWTLGRKLGVDRAAVVAGDVEQKTRDARVVNFQTASSPQALIATMGTLREGVTLHRARTVLMHDLDWVLARMLQAEKRIHRIGQRFACQSVWPMIEGSIDIVLARVLTAKAKAASQVLGITDGLKAVDELGLEVIAPIEAQLQSALAQWEGA